MKSWAIWVPFIPPSSNELKRLHFLSVASSRRNVHEMMQPLLWSIQAASDYAGPAEKVRLIATFHWTDKRRRDIGNHAESLKAIIDSLVGVCIPDDDVKHITELVLRGKLASDRKGIALIIEEIADADDGTGDRQRRPKRS